MPDDLQPLREADMKLTDQAGQHSALIGEQGKRLVALEDEFRDYLRECTVERAAHAAEIRALREQVSALAIALDKERSERQADRNQAKAQAGATGAGVGGLVALIQLVLHHLSK